LKISFQGQTVPLLMEGIKQVADLLRILPDPEGIPVEIIQANGPLCVMFRQDHGQIYYQEKIHFFRALSLLVERARTEQQFQITEYPQFDFNGAMIDASRNAVPTVESIKRLLRSMALMGLNGLMMYTEDTYEVPSRPYFGYMRGCYTADELKECDQYAAQLGIEMFPCIQTLGHLTQALKWYDTRNLKDTESILLAGSSETYAFLEELITAASSPYRSRRIHIGMDEAFGIGLGKYLMVNGFRKRSDIMNEHLQSVLQITRKLALKPMIWSDMYFHLASGGKTPYYDLSIEIPDDFVSQIPNDVQFVYWDYQHEDQAFYEQFIDKHVKFGSTPLFAGGLQTWASLSPNYGRMWKTTNPALRACKIKGVREVFATAWGDNGAETNLFMAWPGLQLYAEHGYSTNVDMEQVERRLRTCTGGDLNQFLLTSRMDEVVGVDPHNMYMANPSKFLLWQDVLLGLFDARVEGEWERELPEHYASLQEQFRISRSEIMASPESANNELIALLFEQYEKLSGVLRDKTTLGLQITRLYRANDQQGLQKIAETQLPALYIKVNELRITHRRLWMATCKPFGWEVLDIRYGGVLARILTAQDRLNDYAEGHIDRIEELEQDRLPYEQDMPASDRIYGEPFYHRIATASVLSKM